MPADDDEDYFIPVQRDWGAEIPLQGSRDGVPLQRSESSSEELVEPRYHSRKRPDARASPEERPPPPPRTRENTYVQRAKVRAQAQDPREQAILDFLNGQ